MFRLVLVFSVSIALLEGCGRPRERPLFQLLDPAHTGVTFANTDNDGLPDLFFTGNMVSSRLYLNKGNMRFEDITASAGVKTNGWSTGAALVDINDDVSG